METFIFCYIRVRRARVPDIRCSCLCIVVGVMLGRQGLVCLLYISPSPRDRGISRMPSSA